MANLATTGRAPVVIVGAGPTGLSLAGDLGWRGVPCVLIERGDGEVFQPKMDMVGIRTMEFCRRWGIVEDVENAGYNRDYPQDYAWVSQLHGGYEFGREPFPSVRDEPKPEQSPQKRERCPQNFFDPVLTRFAQRTGKVQIRYRTEYLSHEERPDGVTVRVRNLETDAEETIECDYLVGCDGGASRVKEQLGIRMTGTPVLTYTTNAIIECDGLEKLHDKKPGYRYIFIGPEGTWSTVVAINGRDWWRFSIVGDGTMRTLSEEEVAAAFRRAVGRDDFEFRIISLMPWIRRQLVADNYGTARVKIAGDAAHLTSPTGGFGMNMGIQDSVDLGWKLQAMVEGWGGAHLLDTYEFERRPVAIRNVTEATNNLKLMLTPRENLNARVFEPGPEGDVARKIFGDAYTQMMKREWYTIGIHLGYRYEGSSIVVSDGTPEPEDTVNTYVQTARPGHRAPHAWLEPGRSTLDLFGRGFVLLRFDRTLDVSALESAARKAGVPLDIEDIDNADVHRQYERALVLVRPDGHVAWRADALPDDAHALVDIVRGVYPLETKPAVSEEVSAR
ncbi:monooxygenase FAD-binding protein [Burkholderia multivorans]|uniref:FAD-dependent oxidoreductase n=1 Tax=Burkholderia multivorans TaxID=87883 RepID=UPI0019A84FAD|nr:FAD-dependent oxidoreductase [Burkholderia multivorans]MBU9669190.1 FAD-dependent oxidoreductase [Burkholderia multivorans]CAB5300975.1 monooxygenase FAD-binding protein [Burkholderia multivorans]CAB5305555.1 monooxygenase FAD-binding protein [Burkholderia multivorans]CAB5310480.1 monooxygenase FAD-binding protein [Burkholderia multivorans]CAB5318138.1 3-(3-hydroxy-phenyl)propionate/3-hydroxycinnamic acid hydroxylase [Burkholderia multivorans]